MHDKICSNHIINAIIYEVTWDYIAGFVDGEGSIVRRKRVYNIYITQTNFQVLKEIRDFVGCGSVYKITKRKNHWKEAWLYNAGGGRNTYHILLRITDRLIVKKDLALQVISELKSRLKDLEKAKNLKEERIKKARLLRRKKWTYRKIAKELGTDFGYIRRLVLSAK